MAAPSQSGSRQPPAGPTAEPRVSLLEVAILLALLVYLGLQIVPAHWTSIWLDREFTGWQTPVANRMARGLQLYEDTAHSPMPPLSFVALRLLTGGHGVWFSENLVNFVTQGLIVLLLYAGLAPYLPRPIPFLVALGTLAAFLSFGKTVYYDQLAQLWVAALAVLAVRALHPPRGDSTALFDTPTPRPAGIPALAAMGLLSALAVLTKQNTGGGASIGVLVYLLLFPARLPWRIRCRQAGLYLASCAALFFLVSLALAPFISVRGMIVDVFLTGSEPKGGPGPLLQALGRFALSTLMAGGVVGLPAGAVLYLRSRRRRGGPAPGASQGGPAGWASAPAGGFQIWAISGAALAGVAVCIVLFRSEGLALLRPYVGEAFLTLGLGGAVFIVTLARFFPRQLARPARDQASAIAGFAVVLLPPALLHSLSVSEFRWTVDNNPMIGASLAVLFAGAAWMLGALPTAKASGTLQATLMAFLAFFVQLSIWGGMAVQLYSTSFCTESWPEIRHLRGARLRETAREMRSLVHRVRELAPDERNDAVLLLPGDPNTEAWFERPEPALTSLIIFQDQYWDRYVEEDFRRLAANPPKVIVIGPRDAWPGFFDLWQKGYGAKRLIRKIEHELIPARYEHVAGHPIMFAGILEHMDVYVRRDAAPPPG